VYEILHWILEPVPTATPTAATTSGGTASNGANSNDILVAIVGVVGTLAAAGISALVASFKRAKTPDSIEKNAIRHEEAYKTQIQDLRESLDEANYEKDNLLR
jgi:hypothetical protein